MENTKNFTVENNECQCTCKCCQDDNCCVQDGVKCECTDCNCSCDCC